MALIDDLSRLAGGPRFERCPVAKLPAALEERDALALGMALLDQRVTAADLSRVLRANGHAISADAVRRHRRAVCMCPVDGEAA